MGTWFQTQGSGLSGKPITLQGESGGDPIVADATDLTNWTEHIGGATTVNREAVEQRNGTYCANINIVGGGLGDIEQTTIPISPGASATFSVWAKASATKTAKWTLVSDDGGTAQYLKDDGTWTTSSTSPTFTVTTSYAEETVSFTGHADHSTYSLTLARSTGGGWDLYFDDVSVSVSATNTFQKSGVTTEVEVSTMDDVWLTKGSNQDALSDHEWYWAGNVLYVRDDSGDPDVTGVVIEGGQQDTVLHIDDDYIDVEGITFSHGNDSSGSSWLIGVVQSGGEATYTNISDCVFKHCAGSCLFFDSDNGVVDSVTVRNFDITGIGMYSSSDMTVSNSTVYDDGSFAGIVVTTLAGDTTVSNTTVSGNTVYDAAVGIKLSNGPVETTVSGNTVYRDDGAMSAGIQMYASTKSVADSIVTRNLVYDVSGLSAISIDGGGAGDVTGAVVSYNVGRDSTRGVLVQNGAEASVYNNVFSGNSTYNVHADDAGTAVAFNNNISYEAGGATEVYIDSTVDGTVAIDYNLYYHSGGGTFMHWKGTDYNYADWLTNSGQDGNSPTPTDPLFVDAASADFHLQVGSPAINAGTDVGLTVDYDGETVPSAGVDVGAFEAPYAKQGWWLLFWRNRNRRPRE
jgi:parallel beta-helix repeat protein